MASSTPIAGLPYPDFNDPPNAPLAFSDLVQELDAAIIVVCSSAADRTARYADGVPTGAVTYLADVQRLEVYIGSTWTPVRVGAEPTVTWAAITNKPTTFEPSTHTHSQYYEKSSYARGAWAVSTGTSGRVDIPHGLGATPDVVFISPARGGWGASYVDDRNATTFGVQIRNDTGTNVAGGITGTLYWLAMK